MPFTDGATLTAAQLNTLEAETVPAYASTTARDADIPTPTEGRMCVISGSVYIYTGGSWQLVGPGSVRKTTEAQIILNTTLVDDAQIAVVLPVGTYRVEAFLLATGSTTGDIKTAWAFSGTTGFVSRACIGPTTATTSVGGTSMRFSSASGLTSSVGYGTDGTANFALIHEDILMQVTVSGTLKLQWAQNTTDAAVGTQLRNNSRIYVTKQVW